MNFFIHASAVGGEASLVLKKELEKPIADLGRKGSWLDILADLCSLTETKVARSSRTINASRCTRHRDPPRTGAVALVDGTEIRFLDEHAERSGALKPGKAYLGEPYDT